MEINHSHHRISTPHSPDSDYSSDVRHACKHAQHSAPKAGQEKLEWNISFEVELMNSERRQLWKAIVYQENTRSLRNVFAFSDSHQT